MYILNNFELANKIFVKLYIRKNVKYIIKLNFIGLFKH